MKIVNNTLVRIDDGDIKNGILDLPEHVTKIGEQAFFRCKELKEVKLPSNLIEIEAFAFCGCRELKIINIPDQVKKIHTFAFRDCKKLEKINIPNNVKYVSSNAFDGCENLKYITWKNQDYHVKCINNFCMRILSTTKWQNMTIYKCSYLSNDKLVYGAECGAFSTIADSLEQAISDLTLKIIQFNNI